MSKLLKERWNRLAFGTNSQSLNESQEIKGWQSLSQAIGEEGSQRLEDQLIYYAEEDGALDRDTYEARVSRWIREIWEHKDNEAAVAFALRVMPDFFEDEGGYDDDGYYL